MDWKAFFNHYKYVEQLVEQNKRIAIHACLVDIFLYATSNMPSMIMELGVSKEGLSTKVLSRVAQMFNSIHVSVDLADCSKALDTPGWIFHQSDDIAFAKNILVGWMKDGRVPLIDLLFVDTDELYEHVKQEIDHYFPLLNPACMVLFRCTNLQKTLYYPDGTTTNLGWDNQRGVIRALEDFFKTKFNEKYEFTRCVDNWLISHKPWGAGLTVLTRFAQ